jgi:hypothetical protein
MHISSINMFMAENQNSETRYDGQTEHDSEMLEWFGRLSSGEDVSDVGETYSNPSDHSYRRGGTLGVNAARDEDPEFWGRHVQGNDPSAQHPKRLNS